MNQPVLSSSSLCMPVRLFLLFCVLSNNVFGEFIIYNKHTLLPERPEYMPFPKFSKKDVPNWEPGHGRSFVDLSRLTFSSDCAFSMEECPDTTLELLMFEEPAEFPWIDYWPDRTICCSKDLVAEGKCFQENSLIIPPRLQQKLSQKIVLTSEESYSPSEADPIYHHDIKQTGMYVLLMAVCDPMAAPVLIDGVVDSMDPYGYLPADMFGNLPFYAALNTLYIIVGFIWGFVCAKYHNELMPLQYWISAVLFLGMAETSLLYGHYEGWNEHGRPSYEITMLGLIFGVLKRTVSRVVVQFVALGYGVVRPSLGEDMKRVALLGFAYFALSLIYTVARNLPPGSKPIDSSIDFMMLIVLLLEGVDTTFYIWILSSIQSLMNTLAARKQAIKYILYRDFRAVLFISIFFTAVGLLYEMTIENSGYGAEGSWKSRWTTSALYELMYFIVFVAICYLWAPSKNSQRYAAYDAIEMTSLENDEEWNLSQQETTIGEHRNSGTGVSESEVDAEYGGQLDDDSDPFAKSGALDTVVAIQKKN